MKENLLVIGAGHQGLAMAAHLAMNGEKVNIWNRSKKTIEKICKTKHIACTGVINDVVEIKEASDCIEEVLEKVILVTTPSFAHRDIARMLAPIIKPDSVVILNPGRTFGAIDFLNELKINGCRNIPYVAETQSIIYTCRKINEDTACIYALKNNIKIACVNGNIADVKERIPECMRDSFSYIDSAIDTSLSNIGMILHCAPVLLNVGWIESPIHKFEYYYDGISPSIANILEKMDAERVNVAKKMGVKVDSLIEWFHSAYNVEGESIYECIQNNVSYRGIDAPLSIEHRYLDEDVPNGLVPVEYLGKCLGVDVSTISQIIDLANLMRGVDYRDLGRRYAPEELNKI